MKMSGCMRMRLLVVCMAMTVNTGAHAICAINAGGLSLTPTAASTGTFTPPNAPVAQAVTFTITGTFNAIFGGTCRVALAFNRASAPIAMARVGGGATMPYTVTSLPGGGNTVIFTGGGAPGAAERLQFNFAAPGGFQFGIPFTATLTGYFLAQPGSPQRAGSYSDAIEARLYSVNDCRECRTAFHPGLHRDRQRRAGLHHRRRGDRRTRQRDHSRECVRHSDDGANRAFVRECRMQFSQRPATRSHRMARCAASRPLQVASRISSTTRRRRRSGEHPRQSIRPPCRVPQDRNRAASERPDPQRQQGRCKSRSRRRLPRCRWCKAATPTSSG